MRAKAAAKHPGTAWRLKTEAKRNNIDFTNWYAGLAMALNPAAAALLVLALILDAMQKLEFRRM